MNKTVQLPVAAGHTIGDIIQELWFKLVLFEVQINGTHDVTSSPVSSRIKNVRNSIFFCFSYTNSEFHTSPFRVKATSAFITLVPKINGIIYAMCTAIKSFQDTLLVLFINCLSLRVERVEPNSVYIATARSSDESTLARLAELTSFIISMKSLSKIQYRISKLI